MSMNNEVVAILSIARYLARCDGWEWQKNPNIRIGRRQERYIGRAREAFKMAITLSAAKRIAPTQEAVEQ